MEVLPPNCICISLCIGYTILLLDFCGAIPITTVPGLTYPVLLKVPSGNNIITLQLLEKITINNVNQQYQSLL